MGRGARHFAADLLLFALPVRVRHGAGPRHVCAVSDRDDDRRSSGLTK